VVLAGYNDVWQGRDEEAVVEELVDVMAGVDCAIWVLIPTTGPWDRLRAEELNGRTRAAARAAGVHVETGWQEAVDDGPDGDGPGPRPRPRRRGPGPPERGRQAEGRRGRGEGGGPVSAGDGRRPGPAVLWSAVSGPGGDERPIALFDSGFGGLTVARAVIDLLPDEHVVYVGDTGRYPYGPRDQDEVAGFAHQITRFLVEEHDAKLVIVACKHGRGGGADRRCRRATSVPVVGVIEPGTRALVAATRSGRVGVIGTRGHDRVGRLPAGGGRHRGAGRADLRGLPRLRRVRGAGRAPQRPGPRAGRAAPRPGGRRRRRHPAARLHPTTRSSPGRSPT
jgi:hypothetical protein